VTFAKQESRKGKPTFAMCCICTQRRQQQLQALISSTKQSEAHFFLKD